MRRNIIRREFVAAALASLGSGCLGRLACGQEVGPADDNAIEIPGLGRFSLNPDDYDAKELADWFGKSFPEGLEQVRKQYESSVKTLRDGDPQQLARLAQPLIKKAQSAMALPLVGDGLRKSLMSPAKPEVIVAGEGDPVYFINGLFTTLTMARDEARELAKHVGRRGVSLLYNEGTPPSESAELAGKDVEEAFRDRVWPMQVAGMMTGKSFGAGFQNLLGGQSPLQHNPTTQQLAQLLYDRAEQHKAGQAKGRIALVGYSQGALIVRNALFTLALLDRQKFAETQVTFVAPGLPIADHEVWPKPQRFTPIIDPRDPIPAYLGLRGKGFQTKQVALKHHNWFEDGYASRIKPAML